MKKLIRLLCEQPGLWVLVGAYLQALWMMHLGYHR